MAEDTTKWLDINVSAATYDALKSLGRQIGMSATGTAKALILNAMLEKTVLVPPVEKPKQPVLPPPEDVSRGYKAEIAAEDARWKMMVDRFGGPESDMLPAARTVESEPDGKYVRTYHADDFPWGQLETPNNVKPKDLVSLTIRS